MAQGERVSARRYYFYYLFWKPSKIFNIVLETNKTDHKATIDQYVQVSKIISKCIENFKDINSLCYQVVVKTNTEKIFWVSGA